MKRALMMMVALVVWLVGLPVAHAAGTITSWKSPEGIVFETDSERYNIDKLKILYKWLLENEHGEELKALHFVKVLKEKTGSTCTGCGGTGKYFYPDTITLNDVDNNLMSYYPYILSHEYGHHFTYYWMKQKLGQTPLDQERNGAWAESRNLEDYEVRWTDSGLPFEHGLMPEEIMADDYVELYGSKRALRRNNERPIPRSDESDTADFWENLSGVAPKDREQTPQLISFRHQLVNDEERSFTQYTFGFSSPAFDVPEGALASLEFAVTNKPSDTGTFSRQFIQAEASPIPYIPGQPLTFTVNVPNEVITEYSDKIQILFKLASADNRDAYYFLAYEYKDALAPKLLQLPKGETAEHYRSHTARNNPWIIVDGVVQDFKIRPHFIDGHMMIPLRSFLESLGAQIEWNEETRSITAKRSSKSITLTLDQNEAVVDENPVLLEKSPQLFKNTAMAPLLNVGEALGVQVDWNADNLAYSIATR